MFSALSGIKVLDLSQYVPGPYATLMLADCGADVLKVEPPGGDPMRGFAPLDKDGVSRIYKAFNRNKKTITLNLKTDRGKAAFEGLLERADILLESFRPEVMARLGFSRARIAELNPRLLHCALTGYGQEGPLKDASGHDVNYMALMGGLAASGTGQRPVPAFPLVADHASAMHTVIALLAALLDRAKTGKGTFLDVSIAESVLPWQRMALAITEDAGEDIARTAHLLNGGAACYQVYETKDHAFVTLGALEEKFWKNFCEAVGRPDWTARQFEPTPQRALIGALQETFASATLAEWEERLRSVDCCFQTVTPLSALADHPQLRARGFLQAARQDGMAFTEILFPARANDAGPDARREWREVDVEAALDAWRP
ncbi:MAG: CoA transferase [Alphaproteobacteria bacterium]|nr:CoA transferase [Alphaproteobacteria bacterium]